jgi:hypothetical protein
MICTQGPIFDCQVKRCNSDTSLKLVSRVLAAVPLWLHPASQQCFHVFRTSCPTPCKARAASPQGCCSSSSTFLCLKSKSLRGLSPAGKGSAHRKAQKSTEKNKIKNRCTTLGITYLEIFRLTPAASRIDVHPRRNFAYHIVHDAQQLLEARPLRRFAAEARFQCECVRQWAA